MAIEMPMAIDDVARYRKTIPGPVSPYVALEALFYIALLAIIGCLATLIHGDLVLVLLLPAFFITIASILGLKNDYRLIERSIRAKVRFGSSLYDNILISIYNGASVETLTNIGCDYLSRGGELKLLYVIGVPTQLPFSYGTTQKEEGMQLLSLGMRVARRRNVNTTASIAIARDLGDAVLEMGRRSNAGLIVMGAGKTTTTERFLLGNAGDRIIERSRSDVIVIHF